MKLLSAVGMALLLSLPVGAQVIPVLVPGDGYLVRIPNFGTPAGVPFEKSASGFFNSDLLPDMVVLRDGLPHLFFSPGIFEAVIQHPDQANDVTTLVGQAGEPDEFLTVGPMGLRGFRRNGEYSWVERLIEAGPWQDARLVKTGEFDIRSTDMIGIDETGTKLLVLSNPGSIFEEQFVIDLPGAETGIDILAYNRDLDDPDEIAVLTQEGSLFLYDHDEFGDDEAIPGTTLTRSIDYGILVAFGVEESTTEALGVISREEGRPDQLTTVRDTTPDANPVDLGMLSVVGAVAGDVDNDGDQDLVLSHESDWSLAVFLNSRANQILAGNRAEISMNVPGPATGNRAWPILMDMDGDSDLDGLFPIFETGDLFVHTNRAENDKHYAPRVNEVKLGFDRTLGKSYLRMLLEDGPRIPGRATHIEVTFFRKSSVSHPTATTAFSRSLLPMDEAGLGLYPDLEVTLQESKTKFPAIYFWIQRYVEVIGQGPGAVVKEVFPARVFGFTTSTLFARPGGGLGYLTGLGGAGPPVPIIYDVAVTPGLFPESFSVGTIVEEEPIPDFPEDDEPILTVE